MDLVTPKMVAILLFVNAIGLSSWQTGFAITGNSATGPVIIAKFGWTEEEANLWNSLLSSCGAIGIMIGSLFGGPIISRGRRRAIFITNIIILVGSGIS